MDVWSEYAACRSSAMFRPEDLDEFEGIFCRSSAKETVDLLAAIVDDL
jgi:hypothetical protein